MVDGYYRGNPEFLLKQKKKSDIFDDIFYTNANDASLPSKSHSV